MREYYVANISFSPDDLYHHGIKGQKWGVRRFVNPDGTLTPEGKRRYGTAENFYASKQGQNYARQNAQQNKTSQGSSKVKSAAKIGLAIVGAGLAAYGGYKLSKIIDANNTKYAADVFDSELSKIIKGRDKAQVSINRAIMGNSAYDRSKRDRLLARVESNSNRLINKASNNFERTLDSNIFKKASNAYKYAKKQRLNPRFGGIVRR